MHEVVAQRDNEVHEAEVSISTECMCANLSYIVMCSLSGLY